MVDEVAARRLVEVAVTGAELGRALRAVWPAGARLAGPARDLLSLTRGMP